jgi:hypothetical protein
MDLKGDNRQVKQHMGWQEETTCACFLLRVRLIRAVLYWFVLVMDHKGHSSLVKRQDVQGRTYTC